MLLGELIKFNRKRGRHAPRIRVMRADANDVQLPLNALTKNRHHPFEIVVDRHQHEVGRRLQDAVHLIGHGHADRRFEPSKKT